MFKTLQGTITKDEDYPPRQFRLNILARVLDGSIYDKLPYAFHEEKAPNQDYVPLRERRPSVRAGICGIVVDDSVSLLFSEGHFPDVDCEDETTRGALQRLIKETNLNEVMIEAATVGSVGSVAIFMRVLSNRVFFNAMNTQFLTPVWQKAAPDVLQSVTEQYKVKGSDVGKTGLDANEDYWFRRDWTDNEEIWYAPLKVKDLKDGKNFKADKNKTVQHKLGFVPIVWVKNLAGGDDVDGKCTFPDEAIETGIEIDYQLSQAGRGLKYSSDPTLLLKEPAVGQNGEIIKSGGNAIVVGADGDAKMLEINGTALEAVMLYVTKLRELALEKMHGNRANADKISAAQSGRAMELMNQALIWLADRLRISYGEGAILDLLIMIVKASEKFSLVYKDTTKVEKLSQEKPISLRWPAWYQPTNLDAQQKAQTLAALTDSSIITLETATKTIAADYDIEDTAKERTQADAEMLARNEAATKQVAIKE